MTHHEDIRDDIGEATERLRRREQCSSECILVTPHDGPCIPPDMYPPTPQVGDVAEDRVPGKTVLEEAQGLIYGDRVQDYGPPTISFDAIARQWTAYLETKRRRGTTLEVILDPVDVAHMMVLMKVCRGATGSYKRDTYADIAGYAGCVERIVENK